MIHSVRIYQLLKKWSEDAQSKQYQGLEAVTAAAWPGLTLAALSCSLLKTDPQVLQRHPVMGVRAALATPIRAGLNDKPSSPPQSRHKRLARIPRFLG